MIEPMIAHTKADRLLGKNWLKGAKGDALHDAAVRCRAQPEDVPAAPAGALLRRPRRHGQGELAAVATAHLAIATTPWPRSRPPGHAAENELLRTD